MVYYGGNLSGKKMPGRRPVCHANAHYWIKKSRNISVDRFTSSSRRYRTDSRDKDRGHEAERDRGRDDCPQGRYESAFYGRRRRHGEASPRRRSRSPISPLPGGHHVHLLSRLSEVGEENFMRSNVPTRTPPPYTVAIVAVEGDLVPYAELIEKRVFTEICVPEGHDPSALRTRIVVLPSEELLLPCIADLTRCRVPFAVICTSANRTHDSCTVRIMYAADQKEYQNMLLDHAFLLLKNEFDTFVSLQNVPAVSAAPEDVGDRRSTSVAPSCYSDSCLLRTVTDFMRDFGTLVQGLSRRRKGLRPDEMSNTLVKIPADRFSQPIALVGTIPQNPLANSNSSQNAPVISNSVGCGMLYDGACNRYSQNESGKNFHPHRMGSAGGSATDHAEYNAQWPQDDQGNKIYYYANSGGRNESGILNQTVERHFGEPSGPGQPKRTRGKLGGVSRNGPSDPSRQSYNVGGKGSYGQLEYLTRTANLPEVTPIQENSSSNAAI